MLSVKAYYILDLHRVPVKLLAVRMFLIRKQVLQMVLMGKFPNHLQDLNNLLHQCVKGIINFHFHLSQIVQCSSLVASVQCLVLKYRILLLFYIFYINFCLFCFFLNFTMKSTYMDVVALVTHILAQGKLPNLFFLKIRYAFLEIIFLNRISALSLILKTNPQLL